MNIRTNIVFICLLAISNANAQLDLSSYVQKVYEGNESTALSIFDTNPESPNGQYLAYIKYHSIVQGGHQGPLTVATLIVRDRTSGKERDITNVLTTNHNGANALWVNDTLITCQINHLQDFEIFNVKNGKSILGRIKGELGHKSVNNLIFFSRSNERLLALDTTREPFLYPKQGIWTIDLISGIEKQIATLANIVSFFTQQNSNINGNGAQILHVDPSPDGSKILFDYRHFREPTDKRRKQLQGYVNTDGSDLRWVDKRPMHVVWYDEFSMAGVDMDDEEKRIKRYDLSGEEIEVLGGKACHLGISSDGNFSSGEFGYYWHEPDGYTRVYLYKKGNVVPIAMLSKWQNAKVTWKWVAHVNPSFSRDGHRLYFIRAVDNEDKFEAVYIDLVETGIL